MVFGESKRRTMKSGKGEKRKQEYKNLLRDILHSANGTVDSLLRRKELAAKERK